MTRHSSDVTPSIDLLLVTALTEEAQVVNAVLDQLAEPRQQRDHVHLYEYVVGDHCYQLAAASAHQMGAVGMAVFAAPLFREWRPRSAALIGIAAAVDTSAVDLGDVPFASHVLSYDDIAVKDGVLEFRTEGFQVDPAMRAGAGELRLAPASYLPWQNACKDVMPGVVEVLDQLRRTSMLPPELRTPPHLVVEIVGGGPFLLRDTDFRDSLRKQPELPAHNAIRVISPVHPKLVSAEMESHGFMRAAQAHGTPAIVLKGISDVGDAQKAELEKSTGGFFRAYACSNAVLAALHILARRRDENTQSHETRMSSRHRTSSATKSTSSAEEPIYSAWKPDVADPSELALAWIHLGDLYAGAPVGSSLDQRSFLRAVLRDLKNCPFKPDRFFLTGDIAAYARGADYQVAEQFIAQLVTTADIPDAILRFVPGSHDVDRMAMSRRIPTLAHRASRESPDELDRDLQDLEMHRYLLEAFNNFRRFLERVAPGHPEPCSNEIDWHECLAAVPGVRGRTRIAGLCSVWVSHADDDVDRMVIGKTQLEATLGDADDDEFLLLLIHHPPTWLNPRCRAWLQNYLGARPHILHCSHGHSENGSPSVSLSNNSAMSFAGWRPDSYSYWWGAIRKRPDQSWELGCAPRVYQGTLGRMRPGGGLEVDDNRFLWRHIALPWKQ